MYSTESFQDTNNKDFFKTHTKTPAKYHLFFQMSVTCLTIHKICGKTLYNPVNKSREHR